MYNGNTKSQARTRWPKNRLTVKNSSHIDPLSKSATVYCIRKIARSPRNSAQKCLAAKKRQKLQKQKVVLCIKIKRCRKKVFSIQLIQLTPNSTKTLAKTKDTGTSAENRDSLTFLAIFPLDPHRCMAKITAATVLQCPPKNTKNAQKLHEIKKKTITQKTLKNTLQIVFFLL